MTNNHFNTPVALIIFNRPDLTSIVFETIRQARPSLLLVIADGARNEAEMEKCLAARAVIENIDWDCKVLKNYSDTNLGCKNRVSSGIDWVFSQVEEAIILEDDCLPHPSFFHYCQTMLVRFKQDKRIMHIAGINFQDGVSRGEGDYYFSKYAHIWGWATWQRAWNKYDVKMRDWPVFKNSKTFRRLFYLESERFFWTQIMQQVYNGEINTWDYQWAYACFKSNGYCIVPNKNLISNLGFRDDATHTHNSTDTFSNKPTYEYALPDNISKVKINKSADFYSYKNVFNRGYNFGYRSSAFGRWKKKLKRIIFKVK